MYLNHANIIGAISDCQGHCAKTVLHKFDDERFLQRRHTATYHAFTKHRQAEQKTLVALIRKCLLITNKYIEILNRSKRTTASPLPSMTNTKPPGRSPLFDPTIEDIPVFILLSGFSCCPWRGGDCAGDVGGRNAFCSSRILLSGKNWSTACII